MEQALLVLFKIDIVITLWSQVLLKGGSTVTELTNLQLKVSQRNKSRILPLQWVASW